MDALIVVFLTGLISLFAAFAKKPIIVISTAIGGLLLAISLLACEMASGHSFIQFSYEGLKFDGGALLFSMATTVFTLLMVSLGYERFKEDPEHTGEYIGLLLFSATGAMIMTAFTDMFMFFLGLEILSIPIYVMAGSNKKDIRSNEAALKYFLTGAFATGLLLFGIAWVYGATGSFQLTEIAESIQTMTSLSSILMIGVLLILSSFIFKVGAAPFHFWSPDVYDGAPHAVTGYMASVVKMAAFYAFLKIFSTCFIGEELHAFWGNALAVIIVITLFVGNLSALKQIRLKRLLAFSSISHVGYTLLIILNSGNSFFDFSNIILWIYMVSYGFSIVGIIGVAIAINDSEDRIDALKGLGKRNPFLAIVAVVSILSLAGIPPTAGFFGKYMVFTSAWTNYSWVVIIALINSAISIYYYLRVLGTIVSKSEIEEDKIRLSGLSYVVLSIALIGMVVFPLLIPTIFS